MMLQVGSLRGVLKHRDVKCFSKGKAKAGFGKQTTPPSKPKDSAKKEGPPTPSGPMMAQAPPALEDPQKLLEDRDFEERLKLAKEKGDLLRKEKELSQPVSILAQPEIDYDKPAPSVGETLSKFNPQTSSSSAPVGPGQAFAGVIAVVLLAVFVATNSGSDLQMSTQSYLPSRGGETEIAPEEKARWEAEKQRFEEALSADATNREALEGLAVSLAELRQYKDAEAALEKLLTVPDAPVDAYRLLGEVRTYSGDLKGAAKAYKEGLEASKGDPSLELLQGLAGVLVNDGKAQEASEVVAGVKASLRAEGAQIGAVELELLRGKIFSQWKGHANDAQAVYDDLIKANPEDFRGYLAKAVLLKEEGRKADAERLFIQAKYFAPTKQAKQLVDKISGR